MNFKVGDQLQSAVNHFYLYRFECLKIHSCMDYYYLRSLGSSSHTLIYVALVFALAENFSSVFCTSQYYWGSVISTSSCLIIIDWRQNILCTMYIFPLSCLVPISKIKVYVSINFLSNVEYVLDFYQVPLCLEITTMVSS